MTCVFVGRFDWYEPPECRAPLAEVRNDTTDLRDSLRAHRRIHQDLSHRLGVVEMGSVERECREGWAVAEYLFYRYPDPREVALWEEWMNMYEGTVPIVVLA